MAPVSSLATAAPVAALKPLRIQLPMLIGEVGFTTRSMLRNRSGFPRSTTSRGRLTASPTTEVPNALLASARLPRTRAMKLSAPDIPARPPGEEVGGDRRTPDGGFENRSTVVAAHRRL